MTKEEFNISLHFEPKEETNEMIMKATFNGGKIKEDKPVPKVEEKTPECLKRLKESFESFEKVEDMVFRCSALQLKKIVDYAEELQEENKKQKEILEILKPRMIIDDITIKFSTIYVCFNEKEYNKIKEWLND